MASVPLLYSLGWPGMEYLPCVVVDHVTRDVYTNENKLPLNKLYLNTTANKYVELSSILKLFPTGKDKDAMHNFMTISSEYGMRKFFMDRFQKAYISLDTLMVYIIVYPQCPEFVQARSEVARFLQSYRELPCCRCGFIKRDCRCDRHQFFDEEEEMCDVVGYASGQSSQATQTEQSEIQAPFAIHEENKAKEKSVETKDSFCQTWIAPPTQKSAFVSGGLSEKERPSVKITPINVVAPVKSKPLTVDASCQTRANFDFSVKSRIKTMPSTITKETDSSNTGIFSICTDKGGEFNSSRDNCSSLSPSLPVNPPGAILAPKPPLKISLWKLLDSDSSDDETTLIERKELVTSKHNEQKTEQNQNCVDSPSKSVDLSKESKPSENLTNIECSVSKQAEKMVDSILQNDSIKAVDEETVARISSDVVTISPTKPELETAAALVEMQEQTIECNSVNLLREVNVTQEIENNPQSSLQTHKSTELIENIQSVHLETEPQELLEKFEDADDMLLETSPMKSFEETSTIDGKSDISVNECENISSHQQVSQSENSEQKIEKFDKTANVDKVDSLNNQDNSVQVVGTQSAQSDQSIAKEETFVTSSQERETGNSNENFEKYSNSPQKEADVDKVSESTKCASVASEGIGNIENGESNASCMEGKDEGLDSSLVIEEGNTTGNVEDSTGLACVKDQTPTTDKEENPEYSPTTADCSESQNTEQVPCPDTTDSAQPRNESPGLSGVKPEMSYKKWCHKFEYTPTAEKLYRCTFLRCGQCFDTKKAALLHNKVHGPFGQENPTHIECFKCDYKTSLNKWFDIVRHLKFKHNELITSHEHGCYLCGRDFESSEKLNKHIDFHYSGRYKCVHCGSVLFTWKQVEEHVSDSCEAKDKKEKNLGCPYCPLVFHIRNMRNAHMLSHQDNGLVCAFCDNTDVWENWKQLRKHYQQKHSQNIRSSLNPHKKKEEDSVKLNRPALHSFKIDIKKNPVCTICEEEFEGDEDYFYHMSRKHDFVPYVLSVCEICEKTFRTQKMYDWHMRNTHTEDIKCDKCSFVAKTQAMLKSHKQSRHQDWEHTCVECGKEFAHYRELRMHMARHALHTIYCCEICGEEFKRQRELRAHTQTVHPKQNESLQQECLECDYRCYTRRTMEAHVRKYHPKLAEEIEESENEPPPKLMKPEKPLPPPPKPEPHTPEPMQPPLDPIIARPVRSSGSKRSRKKLKKIQNSEPKVLTEKEVERRRLKKQRRENIERLKLLVKMSSARTRTYADFRDMLALNIIEHPQEQTIDHEKTEIIHSEHDITEPVQKRQKVSKYGRSIVSKPLDDIYVSDASDFVMEKYTEQPQHLQEKQRRAEVQRKRRSVSGLSGVPQPSSWEEDILEYPYVDHCYFALMNDAVSHCLSNPSHQSKPSDTLDILSSQSEPVQTFSISAGNVMKKPHSRKQTLEMRSGAENSGLRVTHAIAKDMPSTASTSIDSDYGKDIQEEIINQELMREVSEIAQQDPDLQDLIYSMQQGNGNNILGAPNVSGDDYVPQGDGLLQPGASRLTSPPKSLNLQGVPLFDPTASPEGYPSTLGPTQTPTKTDLNISAGLTPTKQNMVDFLMSKLGSSDLEDIDMNDDELKLLLNEHMKAELTQLDTKSNAHAEIATIHDGNKHSFNKTDGLTSQLSGVTNQFSSSIGDNMEEFVTADGRIVQVSDGTIFQEQQANETVNLDNPDITSVTPVSVSISNSDDVSKQSHLGTVSNMSPSSSNSLIAGVSSISQSSGIDALLEASELSDFSSVTSPHKISVCTNNDNPEDIIAHENKIMDSVKQVISTDLDLQKDASDTDSSPDKDANDTLEQFPVDVATTDTAADFQPQDNEGRSFDEKGLNQGKDSIKVSIPQILQPGTTTPRKHVVVKHVLQEPATLSVLPHSTPKMSTSSSATTVKLIRRPSHSPTLSNNSRPPVMSGGYSQPVRSVGSLRHPGGSQILRGLSCQVVRGNVKSGHRVVRLTSPAPQVHSLSRFTPQSRIVSRATIQGIPVSSVPSQSNEAPVAVRPQTPIEGTKIIKIIQRPSSNNVENQLNIQSRHNSPR